MVLLKKVVVLLRKYALPILDFYIFSNLHVALATFFLVKLTLMQVGISENRTALFVFVSTLVSYNLIRVLRINNVQNWYSTWIIQNRKVLYLLNGIGVFYILYLSLFLRLKSLLVLTPFLLATSFYVFPLKKYALRNIPYLKLFLIAISWAGITVLFPLIQNLLIPRNIDYIVFMQRFVFVVFITIPFDIRDVNYDKKELKTLPQQLGIRKSKKLAVLLTLLFILLEFTKPKNEQSIIITVIVAVLSAILILRATKKQSKYYSALFIESIPIIWYVLFVYHSN